ncbi:transposase [Streptomyces sp. NBC_01643]|uniref:transposase n=1 Tax=Streptomyces sp. NBC_01643 TaxID=2975906 RepID=UPI002F9101AC|nr:transposase [Streptomyces sp. NBC_01643]
MTSSSGTFRPSIRLSGSRGELQVRAEQTTEEWKARYATRAGVEGTIHQAVATTGARRTRYTTWRRRDSHTSSPPLPST